MIGNLLMRISEKMEKILGRETTKTNSTEINSLKSQDKITESNLENNNSFDEDFSDVINILFRKPIDKHQDLLNRDIFSDDIIDLMIYYNVIFKDD